MKRYFLLFTIIYLYFQPERLLAQDRIITKRNQRIECKILPIKDKEYVYFQILEDGELKYTLLPKSNIKKIDRNYYKKPIIELDLSSPNLNYHRLTITSRAGIGRMSYEVDQNLAPQLKDFQNKERFGFNWELELTYMFSETFGIFLNYLDFSNSVSRTYQFSNPGNPGEPFELTFQSSQRNRSTSLGVEYYTLLSEKASFSIGLGLGRFNHRYDIDYDQLATPARYLGGDLNVLTKLNFNYRITNNLSINAGLNFMSANMTKVREITDNSDIELDLGSNPWSVSRTNFTLGIRYGFNF